MDFHRIKLLFHTLKFLKGKQIYYRLLYFLRNRFLSKKTFKDLNKEVNSLMWNGEEIYFQNTFHEVQKFVFLNLQHDFANKIDWNYKGFGKLWTYNLNYFEFLNQRNITTKKGLDLIEDYIEAESQLQDGLEPYPISLRGINWIKFLSRNRIKDFAINEALYKHYQRLYHNLEYHLLGNHLLENGFSLFFGAYYFNSEDLYKKAKEILELELNEQVLDDGGHFELSPMYHQIILHRLLDCINLAQQNPWREDRLLPFLQEKARKMLSWLNTITYDNGEIPMVNDSAFCIAPGTKDLITYANNLELDWKKSALGDSGYRKFNKNGFEVLMDVGNVGPDYQPGHAHSDTLSFEMCVDQKPFIVDTGTSTYEKNDIRQRERETAAHNTVVVGGKEQSQVWGGFRVAKRAKIVDLGEGEDWVRASHNGYAPTIHQRKFAIKEDQLLLIDDITNPEVEAAAYFHFHPNIQYITGCENGVQFPDDGMAFYFEGDFTSIDIVNCEIAVGFNNREKAKALRVAFGETLKTTITRKSF